MGADGMLPAPGCPAAADRRQPAHHDGPAWNAGSGLRIEEPVVRQRVAIRIARAGRVERDRRAASRID